MINLGLHGPAGSGKNTVADYLSERYGFVQYAFADDVRDEVQAAYNLPDQSLLRDRAAKETPTERLALVNCLDAEFICSACRALAKLHPDTFFPSETLPLSPRQVLQWWGAEYRRAQDEEYWIVKASERLYRFRYQFAYPEQRPQLFICTDCRYENERRWITGSAFVNTDGNVWHLRRDAATPVNAHASEAGLPVLDGEREIWNNGDIEHLHQGIDLLLRTSAQFVRCEPMAQMVEPA